MGQNLPEAPSHPVLRLMEVSTAATVEHSARLEALEKSADRSAAAMERLAIAEEQHTKELQRKNDIEERKIALNEKVYGERWSRYYKLVSSSGASLVKLVKHPVIMLPLGAISYGIAKIMANLFGFDMGALP